MVVNRLKEYIDFKGLTVAFFEKSIGMSNASFGKSLKNNGAIGSDKLENILRIYGDINPEWLLTGHGEMIKNQEIACCNKNSTGCVDDGIPLIPISAMAGALVGEQSIMDEECERFNVPSFKGADFMIPVKGDSMTPTYQSGDIVACKRVPMSDLFFQWNKVYVIDTNQGALIKRIKRGSTPERVMIFSDNTSYDPFELPISDIYAVALVIGMIRSE